jgi:hypothetical protein
MAEDQDRDIVTGDVATDHHVHKPSAEGLWMDRFDSCHEAIDPDIDWFPPALDQPVGVGDQNPAER